jgi:type III secretory pathway component EscV
MKRASSNSSKTNKKIVTDAEVKRKAVKLVISHMKKKMAQEFVGIDLVNEWIEEMDKLLQSEEFELAEYIRMRKNLNDVIERILDENMRFKLRDSWYSFGRALDKKVKY